MSKIVIPPFLKAGDKIGVVAPASTIRYEDIIAGINFLKEAWNLEVAEGKTLKSSYNQFSATDEDRLTDLQAMLDDSSVKAIIAARGGYGCSRIIDQLDFTKFKKSPKWIVGFSDLTAILSQLYNLGFTSLHAPMVKSMMLPGAEEAKDLLGRILFGELPEYYVAANPLNRTGSAEGTLVGGNLCLFTHLIGSDTEIDTDGKLLFIEDVNEYLYNLDRMLIQLKRSGKLKNLAGLIVCQFSDMRDNTQPAFGKDANAIVQEHVAGYSFPVCFDFPVGHVSDNKPMIVGMDAFLEVKNDGVRFGYSVPQENI